MEQSIVPYQTNNKGLLFQGKINYFSDKQTQTGLISLKLEK